MRSATFCSARIATRSARWRSCPSGDKGALGLLAIGASDRDRFHPGMSTEFLSRIGDLTRDALSRPLSDAAAGS